MTTEKHLGYAIQWFGLFAILFIMTLVIGLRKDENNKWLHYNSNYTYCGAALNINILFWHKPDLIKQW